MKRSKRIICLILALLMGLGCLFGCNDGNGSDSGDVNGGDNGAANGEPAEEYKIIFAEGDEYGNEAKQAAKLQSGIKEKYGVELEMSGDYLESGAQYDGERREILVGHTGYPQSKSAAEKVTRMDHLVTKDGNKIVLIGGTADVLEDCVDYFLENCLVVKDGNLIINVLEDHMEEYVYEHEETTVKISSLNLRWALKATDNNQSIREPRVYNFMKTKMPDSLGVQECEEFWRVRLQATIGKLGYVAVQEKIYSEGGSYAFKNYIWYNSNTTKLVEGGRIWLSETPDKPSQGFGATNYISAGWAILENKETGAQYVHINTHLFVGDAAIRTKEYEVLSAKIKEFTDKGYKVFVTGDFNTSTASDIYKGMTTDMFDARYSAAITTQMGTYTAYSKEGVDIPVSSYKTGDFVFHNDDENVCAEKFEVYDKWDGGYMSDHNALLVEFTFYKR